MKALRLKELKKGEVYYVEEPNRVVRIGGRTSAQFKTRDGIEEKPAVQVDSTLATVEIEGLVDEFQAADNTRLATQLEGRDDTWEETWTERSVHPIHFNNKHAVRELNEKEWVVQLYCFSDSGRRIRLQRTCPIKNKPIVGQKVPASAFPMGELTDAEKARKAVAAARS